MSDLAIDDVLVTNGSCVSSVPTASPSTPTGKLKLKELNSVFKKIFPFFFSFFFFFFFFSLNRYDR